MIVLRVTFKDGTDYGLRIKEEDLVQLTLFIREETILDTTRKYFVLILAGQYLMSALLETIAKYELIMGVSNLNPPAEYKRYKEWRSDIHD